MQSGKLGGYCTVSVLGNPIGDGVKERGIGDFQKGASERLEAGVCRCSDLAALSEEGVHKHDK